MASVDLGNRLLFIDDYGCTSVSACGYFKPNCIYFAQDNLGFSVLPQQEQNMTVYSIKDHNFVDYQINANPSHLGNQLIAEVARQSIAEPPRQLKLAFLLMHVINCLN
ncbi:hypothetical protein Fot_56735 [Forsythia ovata]|uniref:KIB1-4 beta-propeller domain-containing protein n=1 Tax=Forsythia ovata TaxID=205694 RepID=A0ABD1NYY1_9LAMI